MMREVIREVWNDGWLGKTLIILSLAMIAVPVVACILILLFPQNIPTVHLNNTCQVFYQAIMENGITHYYPVRVCP
jgi:hypothetical protein